MKRLLLALALLLAIAASGYGTGTYIGRSVDAAPPVVQPESITATSAYYALGPGWCGSYECAYVRIGGNYRGRSAQVCIQDTYGFTFSCKSFTVLSFDATYGSLSQAYSCLPTRSWAWLNGVGTTVSGWVDLC